MHPRVPPSADGAAAAPCRTEAPPVAGRATAAPVSAHAVGPGARGVVAALLAVPLVGKLVGANTLMLVAAATVLIATGAGWSGGTLMVVALASSFTVNVVLVWLALRPLSGLEEAAARIQDGDPAARVPSSALADRHMRRISETVNALLDRLMGDRTRMRALAAQVVRAQDEERARVARELHESTAQTLAAVLLQLRAVTAAGVGEPAAAALAGVRETVAGALDEVRTMAQAMSPAVLEGLGCGPALDWVARQAANPTGIPVHVEIDTADIVVPRAVSAVLVRVAQEGLRNAMAHSGATAITLRLEADDRTATLEVVDNGAGFDAAEAERRRSGMGLFVMRERVALVDGTVEIYSVPGRGTRVSATVPLPSVESACPAVVPSHPRQAPATGRSRS